MPTTSQAVLLAALLGAGPALAQIPLGDLEPGPGGSHPQNFVPIAGGIVFNALTTANGAELWFSDGTAAGTRILETAPGPQAGVDLQNAAVRLGDRAVFFGYDTRGAGVFVTDGTPAGTNLLAAPTLASGSTAGFLTSPLLDIGGRIVFAAGSPRAGLGGLFVTDGSAAGTVRLADLQTGFEVAAAGRNGLALFVVPNGQAADLWRSDGTVAGTRRVAGAGPGGGELQSPALLGGGLALLIERNRTWSGTDGLAVYDAATDAMTTVQGMPASWPWQVVGLPGPNDAPGRGVAYLVDGQGHGVVVGIDPVTATAGAPVSLGEPVGRMIAAHGRAWLTTGQGASRIWNSDGTAAGTSAVWPPLGTQPAVTNRPQPIGANRILFSAGLFGRGIEPWTSDGVFTRPAADVLPGRDSSQADGFAAAPELGRHGLVLCSARNPQNGTEPYAFDLAQAGCAAFEVARTGCSSQPSAPRLDSPRPPISGATAYSLELSSSSSSAPAAVWFGSSLAAPATPCAPELQPLVVAGLTLAADGSASLPVPLPSDVSLVGARLYVTAAVARPGGSFLGIADFSAVHVLTIGE